MKKHEIFYSLGILIIILSAAYYFVSSSPGILTPDGTIINLTGEKGKIDSSIVVSDAMKTVFEEEKAEKNKLLWFTVPIGILLLGVGVGIKRKTEGPDLFIDRDGDDEDFF